MVDVLEVYNRSHLPSLERAGVFTASAQLWLEAGAIAWISAWNRSRASHRAGRTALPTPDRRCGYTDHVSLQQMDPLIAKRQHPMSLTWRHTVLECGLPPTMIPERPSERAIYRWQLAWLYVRSQVTLERGQAVLLRCHILSPEWSSAFKVLAIAGCVSEHVVSDALAVAIAMARFPTTLHLARRGCVP